MEGMVEMKENLLDHTTHWSMDFTVLIHLNRVQYSFITDALLQFVESRLMELTLPTVMYTMGLSVVAQPEVSALLDQTKMIPENIVSIQKASSHLAPVVSGIALREMALKGAVFNKGDKSAFHAVFKLGTSDSVFKAALHS